MNTTTSFKTALVGLTLAGLSFCVMPTLARAQASILPPSVSLPEENLDQLISTGQLMEVMVTYGWLPNDVDVNERMGYVFGTIEFRADTTGQDGFGGPYDPSYYDSIPFTEANRAQYLTLAAGYYSSAAYCAQAGLTEAAADFAFSAGFYEAISDGIYLDTFGLL